MLVMKFGGTSVKDAEALSRVADIVSRHVTSEGGLVVVLSATAGTTNRLLELAELAAADEASIDPSCKALVDHHQGIVRGLISDRHRATDALDAVAELGEQLHTYLTGIAILKECTDQSRDTVASFGERLSTTVFHHALLARKIRSLLFDAADVIRTNDEHLAAVVDMDETDRLCDSLLRPMLHEHDVVVTQGFIGSTSRGTITTLGRGGSDASAAILGAALHAEEIKIWTDVSGVYSADPRIVAEARPVPSLSFGEVRDLALYGAKVLHPDTIVSAVKRGVPVHVCNTFAPDDPGTVITSDSHEHGDLHAVSVVRECQILVGTSRSVPMAIRSGNIARRLLLESSNVEHGFAVAHTPSRDAVTDVAVAVAGQDVVVDDVSLVVVTGPRATSASAVERIARTLSASSIPVTALISGISEWSTFVVLSRDHAIDAVRSLHDLIH
jgi:bifunctional aspartokinase / homoserine dehydrogenase 1